jgi:hypothetical protein
MVATVAQPQPRAMGSSLRLPGLDQLSKQLGDVNQLHVENLRVRDGLATLPCTGQIFQRECGTSQL